MDGSSTRPKHSLPPASVLKYYLSKATKSVEFYRPVMSLFFLAEGLIFTQIAILEAIYDLRTVLGERPSGDIGDRVRRRNSLLLGTALTAATLIRIDCAGAFLTLAVLYVCLSMGYNASSGSEDAWLYDTLTDDLSEDEFAAVRGRGESVSLAIGAGAAIVGGYLETLDLSYPWFVAAVVTGLGVVVLMTIEESAASEKSYVANASLRETLSILWEVVGQRNPRQSSSTPPCSPGGHPLDCLPPAGLQDGPPRLRCRLLAGRVAIGRLFRCVQSRRGSAQRQDRCDS